MTDYISREALLALPTETKYDWTECVDIEDIKNFPAADVEPVVRCRECKYYHPSKVHYMHCAYPGGMLCPPDANGFCSYGQRKNQSDTIGKLEVAL